MITAAHGFYIPAILNVALVLKQNPILHLVALIRRARKKGHMPPSGLMVLTDTQTHNLNTITQLYLDRKFRTPTVILSTSNDIEYCKEWRELAQKCPYFMLADIDKIKEREQIRSSQGYDMER